ncbi:beta-galactosidase [Dysgonomonas sp. 520]|uniref:beta-galactosidase n=1 Tax=Dysgonomonas sp. 520 TaxID=2302931 RepID=UPI0013CFDD8E|nr:beta-galactosidase [Dysgonomonas sp. 520]NDW10176.1 beta-galactosidase [Dysgonomonas sp. 520]
MKNYLYLLSIFLWMPIIALSQQLKVIDNDKLMEIGTYYYPEQWPENEWERDIKKIKDLGLEFTHYGEFAWSTMEPEEGRYNFDWLDKAIELAAKHNLKVILCTPTPTPPAWLTNKHPDVLIKNSEGRIIQHGGRQQASWNSLVYRNYVEKIVTMMAKRYANNKTVWGWQIDNEPSHYSSFDYSDNAQKAFRQWLEKKYTTINNLNTAWGTAFWSQTYNNFEQIIIPNGKETLQKPNPHAMLDFKRFTGDAVSDFVLWQQDLLKKHIPAHQWVTTNLMADHSIVDPLRFKKLDFVTYTKYLVAGFDMGHGEQGFRMGSSNAIGFANDWFRNITGTTGVMELQPGQVNWGWYNPQTMKGTVRMWIYHVMAGGNKFVCNYRFRQPLTGLEQYHYGIMQTDGTSVSTSGEEYTQVAKELRLLRKEYNPEATAPKSYSDRKTAILYSTDSRWDMEHQPQTFQWDYVKHINKYYKILQSFVAPVDVIDETHDFSQYPVLIVPACQLLDKKLVARWKEYADNGGHLVITCRTGQKNRQAHLWNEKLSAPIYDLIGAEELFFDMLPEERTAHIKMDGNNFKWNNWADVVKPSKNTEIWASYSDQFYEGKAAVTRTKSGKGSVTFIGVDSDDAKTETVVLKKVYDRANIGTENLPEGVVMQWKHGFWFAMNYSSVVQTINIPANSKIIIGQKDLKPAEVVIWK